MIKEVIVVEGTNDTKRLKSFFDCDTIETHGLGLKKETIELIKQVNDNRGVILFFDPDTPGEKIRERINKQIPNLKNAFVLKQDARTTKKVGVEHADKQVLEQALNNLVTYCDSKNSITMQELYELGLCGQDDSDKKREEIARRYHLGKCNGKTLLKRLNMLGVDSKEIQELFKTPKIIYSKHRKLYKINTKIGIM
ncbi:MAG: ribonuclease M5 [Erysipelotrichaceae bacterium]|nr:ribonuclease M5 [Erysipelotrichaceae bacterium]